FELVDVEPRRKKKDPAVPAEATHGEVFGCLFRSGLLDELGDHGDAVNCRGLAEPDVAVTGFGAIGCDAEGDERAGARRGCGALDAVEEGRDIADRMV